MYRPVSSRDYENNVNIEERSFPRSLPSNTPQMIHSNHELYSFNSNNKNLSKCIDRQMQSTRTNRFTNNRSNNNINFKNEIKDVKVENNFYQDRNIFSESNRSLPVQNFSYSNQSYRMNNFYSLNNIKDKKLEKYYDMNPINTRKDIFEQLRNDDTETFKEKQGGPLKYISNNKPTATRNNRQNLKNRYMGNGRNMAIPRDNI